MSAATASRQDRIAVFLAGAGWGGAERRLLAGDASFRRYDRLSRKGRSAVLMDAPPPQEDVRPFMKISALLNGIGLSAPRVLAADVEAGLLLIEDFGDDTYTRLLAAGADEGRLYRLAVDLLIQLQRRAASLEALPAFDDARCLAEVDRLLDWYWPAAMGGRAPEALKESYAAAWRLALPFRHRVPDSIALFDFHVDNLMLLPDRAGVAACGLLDFQDAVRAPLAFDLMSLIEDARRDVPAALARELRERFLAASPTIDRADFAAASCVLGAERHARILGQFARLAHRDGKPDYLALIPRVWRQLEGALRHPVLAPVALWFERHLPPARRIVPEAGARP